MRKANRVDRQKWCGVISWNSWKRERGSNEETEIELEIGTEKKSERKRKNASKRIKEKNMRYIEEGGIYRNVYSYAIEMEQIEENLSTK